MTKLPVERRQAYRAAVTICDRLTSSAPVPSNDLPLALWHRASQLIARLQLAQSRRWQAASQVLMDDLFAGLGDLISALEHFQSSLPPKRGAAARTRPADLLADLAALDQEFTELQIDLADNQIRVLTEPIALEGIQLGPFRIVLHWDRIGTKGAYKVIAEEPRCPSGREDVTHPHVCERRLCEGDGAAPIQAALASGRLLDFFVLVRQILETYNSASAHVALDHWEGTSCKDCGSWLSPEEGSTCERCDDTVCGECIVLCAGCDCYVCSACTAECQACSDRCCLSCLQAPPNTEAELCSDCLQPGEPSIDSQTEMPAAATPPPPQAPNASAAADAVRDGEATVPS